MDFESIIQKIIFPDLERGRKNFDLPHTKAVVHWIKEILIGEPQLNPKVLITAAYAHDWGYIDMGIGSSMDQVQDAKEQHMRIGATRIKQLLSTRLFDEFTPDEVERVSHLVFVHDRLTQVHDDDEIALVEADTLGALDTDIVKPTFSKEDNERYIYEQVLSLRRPLFRHRVAIDIFEVLLQKRIHFYDVL